MNRALVLGTGRMGRDLGLHLARRGFAVHWVTRRPDGPEPLLRWAGRRLRSLHREHPEAALGTASVSLLCREPLPEADLVWECIEEDLETKQALLGALPTHLTATATLLSCTSSILPESLHPRLSVAHVFYPMAHCPLVEWLPGPALGPDERSQIRSWLDALELEVIEENTDSAFFINRLLLPLQAACLEALQRGLDPQAVDRASETRSFPVGQLALMDSIGLDVVCASVRQYRDRLPASEREALAPLQKGLEQLLLVGKRGRKNSDGLLLGSPLPWKTQPEAEQKDLHEAMETLAQRTCEQPINRGWCTAEQLARWLKILFGAP